MSFNYKKAEIKYKSGYKYKLEEDYCCRTSIHPEKIISNEFIRLDPTGFIFIKKGYLWELNNV